MISKDKGNIGESIVLAEFIKRGIQVSIPFGDNARYDLIADFNGKLNRIQIKYCGNYNEINQSWICPCASSTNHTTNKHRTTYENDVDYMAFYLAQIDTVLLVSITELIGKKTITFRNTKPKNNQSEKVHWIENYLIDKTLCVETLHDKSND